MQASEATNMVLAGQRLDDAQMTAAMAAILDGSWTPVQTGAFLVALRARGETPEELAAAGRFLLERCVPVEVADPAEVLDTAGTGGDRQNTFNISTAAAFVAAACGARVAKHGNRAQSGKCGSSDLLAALGVDLQLPPERLASCLADTGICFMFAPMHHPSLKTVAPVRQELGVRTMFNLLGPLVNPARAGCRLAGVFDAGWLAPYARTLLAVSSRRAVVVHAGGLDEFSVAGPSRYVLALADGRLSEHEITPQQVGLATHELASLRIDDLDAAVAMFRGALSGEFVPGRDAVAINAGAALLAAGLADTLEQGVEQALAAIASGAATGKVEQFVAASSG